MSQNYSFKFDQMRDNNPADKKEENGENQSYDQLGRVRNLCLIWPDGRKKFLNYAYLVSGEYSPEESNVTLTFTSNIVIIKGAKLEGLFEELLEHIPKQIICVAERYNQVMETEKFVVNEIQVIVN